MINIQEKYPRSYELYKQYVLAQVAQIKDLDKEIMAALPVDNLVAASLHNTGKLYEFLDSKNIELSVYKAAAGDGPWLWNIQEGDMLTVMGNKQVSRVLAEKEGLDAAFAELEKK